MARLPHGLRALAHRNFRVFLAGQGTAQTGNWLQLVATSWLMYSLTESTFMLGLCTFALHIPFLFIAPMAGVLLDRVEVRRVMFVTNSVAFLQSACMLFLVATGRAEPWHLVIGNLVLGMVNACDAPARQSLLVQLVGRREDLSNAIALNSSMMTGARFVGPMVGGSVIALAGVSGGFAANALFRFAVLGALAALRLAKRAAPRRAHGAWRQFTEGLAYAFGFLPTRSALLLLMATSMTVQAYPSLMPWFAAQRFQGGAQTLGLLIGGAGLGALSGMVYLATRSSVRGLLDLIAWTAALAGAALLAFSFTPNLWLALVLIYLTGMGMMLTAASTNTLLQTIVPDELRGRVASIYVVSFVGVSPFGALAVGWLAEGIGPPRALALFGGLTLVATIAYARQLGAIRRAMQPVFDRLGIPP